METDQENDTGKLESHTVASPGVVAEALLFTYFERQKTQHVYKDRMLWVRPLPPFRILCVRIDAS